MKTCFALIMVALLSVTGWCQEATAGATRALDEEVVLIEFGGSGVSGSLKFASESELPVHFHVILTGLTAKAPYTLCLNTKGGNLKGAPFQDEGGGEGFYDFAQFVADESGNVDKVVLDKRLPAGDYDVKFLVKDMNKNYTVVALNNQVQFTVIAEKGETEKTTDDKSKSGASDKMVTLDVPKQVEHMQLVNGTVKEPSRYIYVFIHPMTTNMWWVQRIPSPAGTDGKWQVLCYFGTESEGIGEYFEVAAIAPEKEKIFKEGQVLKDVEMREAFDKYKDCTSEILTVRRAK